MQPQIQVEARVDLENEVQHLYQHHHIWQKIRIPGVRSAENQLLPSSYYQC